MLPRNDVSETISFYLIKNSMEFHGEGNRDTSATAVRFITIGYVVFVRVVGVIVVVVNNKVSVVLLGCLAWLLGLSPALGTGLVVGLLVGLVSHSRSRVVEVAWVGRNGLLRLGSRAFRSERLLNSLCDSIEEEFATISGAKAMAGGRRLVVLVTHMVVSSKLN